MATTRKKADPSPEVTRLDDNVTEPATVAPGDAPHDTTDPTERATTVKADPSPEALKAGTVNGVLPVPADEDEAEKPKHRWEEYPATRPNGEKVTVRHNLDTGATEVK